MSEKMLKLTEIRALYFLRYINKIPPNVCTFQNLIKKQAISAHPTVHILCSWSSITLPMYRFCINQ